MFSPSAKSRWLDLLIAAILPLFLLFFWEDGRSPAQDKNVRPNGRIEGHVQGANRKPEAAVVHLEQYTLGRHAVAVTADAQGKFGADRLPLGRYRVTIRGELMDDVAITPKTPTVNLTLKAPPWRILRGTVRDKAKGTPISGAIVFANMVSPSPLTFKGVDMGDRFDWSRYTVAQLAKRARNENARYAFTDADGRYEMKIGAERGVFFAESSEMFPQGRPLEQRVRGVQNLDFALERRDLYRVHGRVTHENGKPFATGRVRFFMRRDPHRYIDLVTDDNGRYAFDPDYHLSSLVWMQVEGYSIMHQYTSLDKPPPFAAVDWILKHSQKGTLKVTVRRADGKGVPDGAEFGGWREGAQVDAPKPDTPGPHIYYREEADRWGQSGLSLRLTKGKGQLEMDPGTYAFSMRLLPLTDVPEEQRRNLDRDLSSPGARGDVKFSILPGQTTDLIITAALASALTIVVTDERGAPVPGVDVAAFRWENADQRYTGTWGTTPTNDKGELLLDPVKPGRYVFHPANGGSGFEPLRRYSVKLTPGKHERLTMVVTKKDLGLLRKRSDIRYDLKVRGQVLMPDGVTPAAFAPIYVEYLGQYEYHPQTYADAQGKFTLANRSTGPLTISSRSHGTALTSAALILGKDDAPAVHIVLKKAATIHGRVLNADGTAASDVRLWLGQPELHEPAFLSDPYQGGSSLAVPVRRDGRFTMYGVAPGKQQLCAYRHGQLQIKNLLALDIREGEIREDVRLTVEPDRVLEIHFKRADGKPMPTSYEARLHTDWGALSCGGMEERRDIARSKSALPPGRYHLWLERASWAKRDLDILPGLIVRNIDVKHGQDAQRLDITIPAGGAIKGRVVLPDGTPAAALRVAVHVTAPSDEHDTYLPLALLRDPAGAPSYADASIDPDGNYTLFGLVPGRYRLSVRWRGKAENIFVSHPIEVKAGQIRSAGTWTVGR